MILTDDEVRAMRASSLLAGARLFWALADDVAAVYGVKVSDMVARGRGALLANDARHHLCKAALARGLSSVQVGRWLGGRDHSTILHSAKQATGLPTGETALVFVSRRG